MLQIDNSSLIKADKVNKIKAITQFEIQQNQHL